MRKGQKGQKMTKEVEEGPRRMRKGLGEQNEYCTIVTRSSSMKIKSLFEIKHFSKNSKSGTV